MPQMLEVLSERAIVMLTTQMFTVDVPCELNVRLTTISHLKCHFQELGSTCKWPDDM